MNDTPMYTRPTFETNNMLILDNDKYNTNVLDEDQVKLLMVKLNLYTMSADSLSIKHLNISGYSVDSWLHDLKNRLTFLSNKKTKAELDILENRLDLLLSHDKKVDMELNEIVNLLKQGE